LSGTPPKKKNFDVAAKWDTTLISRGVQKPFLGLSLQ
jgi:hypothetical protein